MEACRAHTVALMRTDNAIRMSVAGAIGVQFRQGIPVLSHQTASHLKRRESSYNVFMSTIELSLSFDV